MECHVCGKEDDLMWASIDRHGAIRSPEACNECSPYMCDVLNKDWMLFHSPEVVIERVRNVRGLGTPES